jgi:predicted metal-binding protein
MIRLAASRRAAEWVRGKCLHGCDTAGRCLTCPPRVVAAEGEPYHRYALLLVE